MNTTSSKSHGFGDKSSTSMTSLATNNIAVHAVALCELKKSSNPVKPPFTSKPNDGFNDAITTRLDTPSNKLSYPKSGIDINDTVAKVSKSSNPVKPPFTSKPNDGFNDAIAARLDTPSNKLSNPKSGIDTNDTVAKVSPDKHNGIVIDNM